MTRDRWDRLKRLFQEALDQPSASRGRWLEAEAAGDTELLDEARALLEVHDTAGAFLEEPHPIEPDDLAAALASGPYTAGTLVGPYRILEEIGHGGMGVVYLAEDLRLGRRVALKSLPSAVAGDASLRERLRREARAAATISHPAVATVYALEEIDDDLLLVTEYVPGRTLREALADGALEPSRAVEVTADIARALGAAHDAGVIHRDLKPENVIITPGGAIKVVDFGIAYVEGVGATRHTAAGTFMGTPAYMAPEQLAGERGDARADLYAAGVVLAEMVSGRHPLSSGDRLPVPAALEPIVARCLQPDPAARFPTAHDLLRALELASGASPGRPSAGPTTPARWWWEFHQGIVALVYWLMVIPAWQARNLIGGLPGRVVFIAALAAVIVAANLRLHLWFTSRFYPDELPWLRSRVGTWIHMADWLFVAAMTIGGLIIDSERSPQAILLLSVGIGAAVGFLVIEPATARAAFRSSSAR